VELLDFSVCRNTLIINNIFAKNYVRAIVSENDEPEMKSFSLKVSLPVPFSLIFPLLMPVVCSGIFYFLRSQEVPLSFTCMLTVNNDKEILPVVTSIAVGSVVGSSVLICFFSKKSVLLLILFDLIPGIY
jgi:hypothetical protein